MPPRPIILAQMNIQQTPNELRMSGESFRQYMHHIEVIRNNIRIQIQSMLDNNWTFQQIRNEYANEPEIVRISHEMEDDQND